MGSSTQSASSGRRRQYNMLGLDGNSRSQIQRCSFILSLVPTVYQTQSASFVSAFQFSRHNSVPFSNNKRRYHGGRISYTSDQHFSTQLWESGFLPNKVSEVNVPGEMSEHGFFEDVHNDNDVSADESKVDQWRGLVQETTMYDSQPAYCAINLDDLTVPYISRLDSESTFVDYTKDGICVPAGPVGRLKEQTANFLRTPSVEIIIAVVVILNSLLMAISTLDSMDYFLPAIRVAENFVVTIFCADFFGRWFSSSKPAGQFVLTPQFVVDVLVVILPLIVGLTPSSVSDGRISFLPSALTKPSGLFNLQLLRVLRLRRVLQDLDTFERFMERALGNNNVKTNVVQDWQLQLARVLLTLFTIVSVSTGLIYTAENAVNPKIDNYFDALYFGLTTLTTVGFGDVTPVTWQGKLVVCGTILFGIGVVPAQGAALLEALLDREEAKKNGMSGTRKARANRAITTRAVQTQIAGDNDGNDTLALDTSTKCPNCGASFHWASAQYCYSCGEEL